MFSWLFFSLSFNCILLNRLFPLPLMDPHRQEQTNWNPIKKFSNKLEFDLHQHDALYAFNKQRTKEKFCGEDLRCWSSIFRSLHVSNKQLDLHHLNGRRPMHFSPITINLRCWSSANFRSLISLSPSKAHNRKFVSISVESFLHLKLELIALDSFIVRK